MARITERITDPKVLIQYQLRKILSMRNRKDAELKLEALKAYAKIHGFYYVFEEGLAAPPLPSKEAEDVKALPPGPRKQFQDSLDELEKRMK